MRIVLIACGVALAFFTVPATPVVRANEEEDASVRKAVTNGLNWLSKQQQADGHWEANGGAYPATATALAGMALLMEGSTMRDGKYSEQIRKAVDWFCRRSQGNGLLGNPKAPQESARYIYGHGYGMLFLSQVYGEESDVDKRKQLEKVLTDAVKFSCKAQTKDGGWGYVSAVDGGGFDEGSTTATQLQGLRAARNAGIIVPKETIDNAVKYLEACTEPDGGIRYRFGQKGGGGRPAITAAGICCGFSAGEYDSPFPKKWLKFVQTRITIGGGRMGHDEYAHYYYSQSIYCLGEDRYQKMFKDAKDGDILTWSKYRKQMYPNLVKNQNGDGSWNAAGPWASHIGAIYSTSVNLMILQLDNGTLPIYQR